MKRKTSVGSSQPKVPELITLEVSEIGFVVYGIGPGARGCTFEDEPLLTYLDRVWKKMWRLKTVLNQSWQKLDRENLNSRKNRAIIGRYLSVAAWALALARELGPFQKACLHGPTNPLRSIIIVRLEEIFTKCFVAAHIYGNTDERVIARTGLLTDFEVNGGVNHKTGGVGEGFGLSISDYYLAHFAPNGREPIIYERFGDLIARVGDLIANFYPNLAVSFVREIKYLLESPDRGFGNPKVTSLAKSAMMDDFSKLIDRMLKVTVPQRPHAVAVS